MTTGTPNGSQGRDVGHPAPRPGAGAPGLRNRKKRRPSRGPRWVRTLVFVLTPILILLSLGVLITYTRLLQGPISLARFATPIETSISRSLGALTAKVDDVRLVLRDDYGFEFRLVNLTLFDSSGRQVAMAPIASASLRAGSLLMGQIVPSRVYLIDPNMVVTYRETSGFSLEVASKLIEEPSLVGEGRVRPAAAGPGINRPPTFQGAPHGRQQHVGRGEGQRIDVARLVSELNARARQGMGDNAQLKEIGVRNATVTLDYEGQRSEWLIAEAAVDLNQGDQHDTISGAARIQSSEGPWVLSFHTVESEHDSVVRLSLSARDLVPSSISHAAPALSLLKPLEMPITLDATMQVTSDGDMEAATLAIELRPGQVNLPSVSGTPIRFDQCVFNLAYDGLDDVITISPSTLRWADSSLTLQGRASRDTTAGGRSGDKWLYQLSAVDGRLAVGEFGVDGVDMEQWQSNGFVSLAEGKLNVETFKLAGAGFELNAKGEFLTGRKRTSTNIFANVVSKDVRLLTAVWPRAYAPAARTWFGQNVLKGHTQSGTLKVVSGGYMAEEAPTGTPDQQRISLTLEVGDLAVRTPYGDKPARAKRALVRLENDVFEITVPHVVVDAGKSGDIDIKAVRLSAVDLLGANTQAELAFKVRAPVQSVLSLANHVKPGLWQVQSIPISAVRGLAVGDFKLAIPLQDETKTTWKMIKGEAKIEDLRITQKVGNYALRGGGFNIDVSNDAIDATGSILVNGVGAKVKLQHIIGGALDKQPPIRITTRLDGADRDQLEIDINDIVAGDVPVEVTVALRERGAPGIHVAADLTTADLLFAEVAWRKPPGRKMRVEFDVVARDDGGSELQNIQAVGQGIAIEGWAAIGADNIMREFYFPDFSIDTVSRIRLEGKQNKGRIWSVKAIGPTYDGRKLFSSLFKLGDLAKERPKARNPAKGVDLDAQIENVVGSGNISLKGLRIKVSHRHGKLVGLNGKAKLDNGKDIAILLKRNNGKRTLFADSNDAGRVFKLIDFYPNMVGGRGRLELDLDGAGAASQTGILWTENFRILGDEVASEVFAGAAGKQGKRQVTRQVFEFTRLRLPFSIGHDQFVIKKTYLRGPVLGASVSGKVDYRTRRVNLGGSYIPLQGINSALCGIPLLGEIFTGPKCEGMLGITFAVQGAMSNPQVIVNPLALVAPGIFRDIFQLTNPSTKVTPRTEGRPGVPAEDRVRASGSVASGAPRRRGPTAPSGGAVIDGWSSGTRARP